MQNVAIGRINGRGAVREPKIKKAGEAVKVWDFDPAEILNSPRKVKGKFHTPLVDKDQEYIEGKAVRNAVPDFIHLPILHDFHKERTVGIVTRVVELSDGSFDFEGLIKATDDCNDVWELIEKGNYDQVSLFGKRTCGSKACSVRPGQRTEPCITTALRLDSISVCDDKARNEGTSLYIAKGSKVVFTANDELIKAETTESSLMHTATDYPDKKGYRINSKGEVIRTDTKCRGTCPQYERQDLGKGEDMSDDEVEKDEEKKGDEVEEASVEGDAEESIESKLDKLEMIIEGLVQKDQEAKGGDIPKQDPGESYELPPEAEREYGAPSAGETREDVEVEPVSPAPGGYDNVDKLAAHIHLSSKVGEGGAEEKAVPKISLTDRKTTSPEEVQHWKDQYESGKPGYQKQKAEAIAAEQQKKEDYVNQTQVNESLNPDVARVDIKADPEEPDPKQDKVAPEPSQHKWETKDEKERYKKDRDSSLKQESTTAAVPRIDPKKPWAEEEIGERDAKVKQNAKKQPPAPKDKGGKKLGSEEESKENVAKIPPSQVKDAESKDVKRHATVKDKEMNAAPGGGRSFRTEPEDSEMPNVHAKPGETRPLATGTKPGAPQPKKTPPEPAPKGEKYKQFFADDSTKQFKDEEKAGEMPDINSRLDRLIAVVAQLVQSDAGVHAGVEEEKASYTRAGRATTATREAGRYRAKNPNGADAGTQADSDWAKHGQTVIDKKPRRDEHFSKGTETMKDEEVDTLVKAKVAAEVETISKAYQASLDELKKANADLAARIDKMENETVQKSGVAVILRDGDGELGTVIQSNAAAISAITKAKKAGA